MIAKYRWRFAILLLTACAPATGLRAPEEVHLAPRQGVSESIIDSWPFEQADRALYVDLERLTKTETFRLLAPDISEAIVTHVALSDCFDEPLDRVKEFAVGHDDHGAFLVARVDPAGMASLAWCLRVQGAAPARVQGAQQAWQLPEKQMVAANGARGIVLLGASALVERALSRSARGMPLAALAPDEYVRAEVRTPQMVLEGSVVVSRERTRIAVQANLSDEGAATSVEAGVARLFDPRACCVGFRNKDEEALRRFVRWLDVKPDGSRVTIAFDARESPTEQARDLRRAPELAIRLADANTFQVGRWLEEQLRVP